MEGKLTVVSPLVAVPKRQRKLPNQRYTKKEEPCRSRYPFRQFPWLATSSKRVYHWAVYVFQDEETVSPAHASCLLVNRWAWSSCLSLKEKLTAFIKTTYDISLDSQISFLPSGFCPGIACFSLSSSLSFSPQHAIVRKPGTWKQESIHLIVIVIADDG